jgi:hypothetical protein
VLFSTAEATTTNDWMAFGTREAYLHAIGVTAEVVAWAMDGYWLWPEPDPDGCFGGPDAMLSYPLILKIRCVFNGLSQCGKAI